MAEKRKGKPKTITLRLSEQDYELAKVFSDFKGVTMSELLRESLLTNIEDYIDIEDAITALKEYEEDSDTYDTETVMKALDA